MQEEKVHVRLRLSPGWPAVDDRCAGGICNSFGNSDYWLAHIATTHQISLKRRNLRPQHAPLAMSVPVESAFPVPTEIGDNKGMAARLPSGVLGIPRDVPETLRFRQFVCVVIRKLPPDKRTRYALNLRCLSAG
jgi:hypothetical protein